MDEAAAGDERRFLTFRVGEALYALPAVEVSEVIRLPAVARVPQSPKSLLGLANLRGSVLPLASLRALLGLVEAGPSTDGRAIVLDGAVPVALAVDAVETLVSLDASRIETRTAELTAKPGERLRGAFRSGSDRIVTKIVDIKAMLEADFVQPAKAVRVAPAALGAALLERDADEGDGRQLLVTFEASGQEYALPIDEILEILPAPENLARTPAAETLVLGVAAVRDSLLPILSLRGLLGFREAEQSSGLEKVVVTLVGGMLVGLMVDRMRSILPAYPAQIDPVPAVLAARAGGEARIKAILRADSGRRLVSILEPERLFREDVMQRLTAVGDGPGSHAATHEATVSAESQFLVFRLGEEEFGLPIEAVDEVAAVPEQITRVPRTPKFLEGVVNLRGEVLPVVDQRRRFDLPPFAGERRRQRLVVVRSQRHRAGLIVDSVSEVLSAPTELIEPAPDLTGEAVRLVSGVVNLTAGGRIVLLLDPVELLSRAERGLLDKFEARGAQTPS